MNGQKNSIKNSMKSMKIVKESLEGTPVSESGGFRLKGVTYDIWETPFGKIYAGEQGILSNNDTLIPWLEVKKLMKKYSVE